MGGPGPVQPQPSYALGRRRTGAERIVLSSRRLESPPAPAIGRALQHAGTRGLDGMTTPNRYPGSGDKPMATTNVRRVEEDVPARRIPGGIGPAAGDDRGSQADPGRRTDPRGPRPRPSRRLLMRTVLDASVAVSLPVDETLSDAAREPTASGEELHPPRLMASEVADTPWRKSRIGGCKDSHAWRPDPVSCCPACSPGADRRSHFLILLVHRDSRASAKRNRRPERSGNPDIRLACS